MDRRSLLQAMLALPMASALEKYAFSAQSVTRPAALKVVFDGLFALVVQADRFWEVRAFTPRDPTNLHTLRVFGKGVDFEFNCASDANSTVRTHNFRLLQDGLKAATKLEGAMPEIDRKLCDFNMATERWCQENYWATIDLPAPDRIFPIGPMRPVHFANSGTRGCVPSTLVLEYQVTELDKVTMVHRGNKPFQPVPCEEVAKSYWEGCKKMSTLRSKDPASSDWEMPGMCSEWKDQYPFFCKPGDVTFFFGVGLQAGSANYDHPIAFFNREILRSFPNLRGRLEIDWLGRPGACKSESCGTSGHVERQFLERMGNAHLMEVSAVVDCHLAGPVVRT